MKFRRTWIVVASLALALVAVAGFAQDSYRGFDVGEDLRLYELDGVLFDIRGTTFILGRPQSETIEPIDSVEDFDTLIDTLSMEEYEEYINTLLDGEEPPTAEEWKDMGFVARQYYKVRVKVTRGIETICVSGRWRPEKVQVTVGVALGFAGTATFVFDVETLCAE